MFTCVALAIATAAAGIIAGAHGHVFLAASAAAALATWLRQLHWQTPHEHAFLTLDPLDPHAPALLCAAFRDRCARLQHTRRPALVRIAAPSARREATPIQLDLAADGDLEAKVKNGRRPARLQHPGLWIADHPLPLYLPGDRCVTLTLRLSHGTRRIRASLGASAETPVPRWAWAALLLALAFGCATDTHWLTATTLGFTFQTGLLAYNGKRAHQDFQVKAP